MILCRDICALLHVMYMCTHTHTLVVEQTPARGLSCGVCCRCYTLMQLASGYARQIA